MDTRIYKLSEYPTNLSGFIMMCSMKWLQAQEQLARSVGEEGVAVGDRELLRVLRRFSNRRGGTKFHRQTLADRELNLILNPVDERQFRLGVGEESKSGGSPCSVRGKTTASGSDVFPAYDSIGGWMGGNAQEPNPSAEPVSPNWHPCECGEHTSPVGKDIYSPTTPLWEENGLVFEEAEDQERDAYQSNNVRRKL